MTTTSTPPSISDLRIDRERPRTPERRGGRGWWLALIALVLAAAVVWWIRMPRAIMVTTATANRTGGAAGGITANGYVVARTKASVSAKIAGRMEYLGVH